MHRNIFSQVSKTNGISRPLQESQIFSIEPICILPLNLIFMAGSTGYIPPHRRKNSAAATASMERQMPAITLQPQASSEQVPSTPTQHSNTVLPFFLPRLVRNIMTSAANPETTTRISTTTMKITISPYAISHGQSRMTWMKSA